MSEPTIQQRVRGHLYIFGGLLILALVSAIGTMVAGSPVIALVMGVAAVQVVLIAAFLMHLRDEAAPIKWLLGFTSFFIAVLFAMMLLAIHDPIEGTQSLQAVPAIHDAQTPEDL